MFLLRFLFNIIPPFTINRGGIQKISKKFTKTLKNLYFLNMAFRITAFILVNMSLEILVTILDK